MCRSLCGNQLGCVPWSKYLLNNKVKLDINSHIPFELTKQMDINKNVIEWIHSQISGPRVFVLGQPGAGKTTFIRSMEDQSKFPTENIATDGISTINIKNITFWDFGGQEVLFSTHKFFLVDRCQYILVVDLSKLIHEDEKIRNKCIKYIDFWMKEIHSFTLNHQHSPPVLLLGTHCDLISTFFTSSKIKQGIASLLQLAKFNYLNCVPEVFTFYKSSRKSTLKNNVSGILQKIQYNLEKFKEFDNDNSLQFCTLKHNIELQRKTRPFMMLYEFENIFFANESQENINKYTKLLNVSGIIEIYQFGSKLASSDFVSSKASEIIFLDPKWLSQTFTSIISIKMQSSKNRKGFFSRNQIENNLKNQEIPEHIWDEIIKIFEMFHLIVVLPSGEYYVPAMLHTPKSSKPSHLGNEKNELVIDAFKEKNIKYKCIRRKFEFSPKLPFGFIDKLIVKYLHFPGMAIHGSTWANDFYLYYEEDGNYNPRFYHLLIQVINNENNDFDYSNLMISIFYPATEENNTYFSFFCHFIFQSPHDIVASPIHYSTTQIENIFILEENQNVDPIGDEKNILFNFRQYPLFRKYFISSDIKVYDNEIHECQLIKKLGTGRFVQVFLGKMKFNESINKERNVVFKETRFVSYHSLSNLMNECMMMKIVENQFTIKLLGICIPTMRFLDSRKKIHLSEDNTSSALHLLNYKSDHQYFNHQILMIIEEAPLETLTQCQEVIQEKNSTKLKLKIAFDVARGVNSLYFKSGVKLVHRDVRSENVFIFSLDEKSVSIHESIHAKFGDFESFVVAGPSYRRIENYRFTAPEALTGSFFIPDSKKDVYSFGILFWEILTGKIPFRELKEKNTCDIEKMIIDGYRPPLDILPDDTPPCIIEIIGDCWKPNPSERPTLEQIISILSSELTSSTVQRQTKEGDTIDVISVSKNTKNNNKFFFNFLHKEKFECFRKF